MILRCGELVSQREVFVKTAYGNRNDSRKRLRLDRFGNIAESTSTRCFVRQVAPRRIRRHNGRTRTRLSNLTHRRNAVAFACANIHERAIGRKEDGLLHGVATVFRCTNDLIPKASEHSFQIETLWHLGIDKKNLQCAPLLLAFIRQYAEV